MLGQTPARPKSILLVEDHADSAAFMVRMLGSMGHTVRAAGSCAEARAALGAAEFDLLLCDVGLPDGDGCALMRELRERHGMEAVALTGHTDDASRERFRAAGVSHLLAKPFTLKQLREVVDQPFGGQRREGLP